MNCSKCGLTLPEGVLYCPACNQEVSVNLDINLLEEDLLRAMLEEEDFSRGKSPEQQRKEAIQRRKEAERLKQLKKKRIRNLLILLVILLVVAAGGFFFYINHRNHSVEYLYAQAETEYDQKNYDASLEYLNEILKEDQSNEKVWLLVGECYYFNGEMEYAEQALLKAIKLDPESTQGYQMLLLVYDKTENYQAIMDLKKGITDHGILSLFDRYLLPQPVLNVESGDYNTYLEVTASCPDKELDMFYTLDGTIPNKKSPKYTESIKIEKEGDVVLTIVSGDSEGNFSEPLVANYHIELLAPDPPSVSPDGGQFAVPTNIVVTVPEGISVYYTWNDTDPNRNSNLYQKPISMPEGNNILSLIAVDEKGLTSEVLRCNYIYYPEVDETEE